MTSGRKQQLRNSLDLHVWKIQLRKDCELQGKLLAFDAMGDCVLELLWESGLDPNAKVANGRP